MERTYQAKRANELEKRLAELAISETADIDRISYYETPEFLDPKDLPLKEFAPCDVGFRWQRNRRTVSDDRRTADVDVTDGSSLPEELSVGTNVWFRLQFTVPESMTGRPVYLSFVAKPIEEADMGLGPSRVECLCYRDDDPWQAFDNGHDELLLTEDAKGGESFNLLIEAGTTTLWGLLDVESFALETAYIYAERPRVRDFARNVTVLNELRTQLPDVSVNRRRILRGLVETSHIFAFNTDDEDEYRRTAEAALERLDDLKAELTSELTGHELTAVGHAHIDLAWLWPWSETVRKGARTASNVLTLMEEYEDVPFLQSQPHLYEFIRNRNPGLFERIEERIGEGRWHPTGALWVEPDVNLASSEALARQYLLGKRYFREEFGIDPKITFIPDVFGYSGGLPSIARAADCPYFLTQKMSWNEVDEFPHTSFRWEGIDGSTVLAHFPPADTYNGQMSVDEVRRSVTNHDENAVHDESAYLFGWGDGGGGPTREMIERKSVIDEIGSLPDLTFDSLQAFFERLEEVKNDLPTWTGELYLQKHRGTLTSQATTKRNNRKAEIALREAELWSSLAMVFKDHEYPHNRLEHAWKVVLFNQFHDILPGSSIADVYADADRDYEQAFEDIEAVTGEALRSLLGSTDESSLIAITNPTSWTRDPVVEIDAGDVEPVVESPVVVGPDGTEHPVQLTGDEEKYVFKAADIPALGVGTYELDSGSGDGREECPLEISESSLANDLIRVDLRDNGTIEVTDVETGRGLFEGSGNRFVSYRDHPEEYDAWDIEQDLYKVGEDLPAPTETEVVERGPVRATVRQVREFGDSRLVQEISLTEDSKRIDFDTLVDWHEEERFLKAHFPINVHTTEATYEVHFGHVTRPTHNNTSWDKARFEVPHKRWVDVSEPDYGVAVLNDCKYGVNVDGTDLSLSLLRSPNWPDPKADRGTHRFTYAVYPHEGDLRKGGVVEEAYELNLPATTMPVTERTAYRPISLDADGVIVESVKRAEDGDNRVIIRLYEAWGRATGASLSFGFDVKSAAETSLIEDYRRSLPVDEGTIDFNLDAFEIKTVAVSLE